MIDWAEISKKDTDLLLEAAKFEQDFPSFFRNSGNSWTADEKSLLEFYQHCSGLFGLFNYTSLVGLVYFETITDGVENVHLDLKRGIKSAEIENAICEIRDFQFLSGVQICSAWCLKRNRQIKDLLHRVGFQPTYLTMKFGFSHNKVLEWEQFNIAPQEV